ncbi:MAG: Stk1 family PASTA domain-containing Ser/Thr kinase [Clostridiales bacterium]|nr:Stk1 family PASTA domain-containing Ser/Thr kinase [Clostridiales bacterium]
MDNYIGRLLDNRYEILDVLGTGGMAVVYKARCHRLNRLVAIKILKDDYSQDAEFRRRFHAESQAVAMLNHPNIVSVYDVSTDGDADYIVMELVDGITLKQYMERRGGYLNWKESLHFAMQIAKALEHAHNQGIVHRDIKPHNVMILKNGTAKVTDFGIARMMSSQSTLTKEALGSVHYISPEQAKGGRVDSRSDLYSLGVVMYEMLTGRPPYDGESPVAVALKHINGGATPPSVLNPNIPGGLEQIIMKAMAVDPAQRYASATEMLYDMEEFRKNPNILFSYNAAPVPPSQPVPPVRRPAPPRSTAERVAGGRPDAPRPRPEPAPRPRPRPEPYEEEEPEGRSKGLTIAIAVCGVLVVAAIVVLILVLNGGGGSKAMVQVPNFVGQVYNDIDQTRYPNLVLKDGEYKYDDTFAAGEIISQDPEAYKQVEEGATVRFVISNGPQTGKMLDLVNRTEAQARETLNGLEDLRLTVIIERESSADIEAGRVTRTDPAADATLSVGQTVTLWISDGPVTMNMVGGLAGMTQAEAEASLRRRMADLNLNIQVKEEASEEVEKGLVIRTDPAEGESVQEGQTVILYVSSGSAIAKTTVPDVLGMDITKAASLLVDKKLKYDYDRVESDRPKDEVLTQSIDKGTEVPEGTVVKLTVSKGPAETEPTTQPPTTQPEETSKTITLVLPSDITVSYRIQVYKDGAPCVDELVVEPGTTEIRVSLSGTGATYFDFYVNRSYSDSFKVNFDSTEGERIVLDFSVSE